MLSVFSKRYIAAPIAGLLLSMGVNAMSQGQGTQAKDPACQLKQQQYCESVGLCKPKTECGAPTCIQTRNEATLKLIAGTTIHVRTLKTLQCQLVQGDCDSDKGSDCYPIDKVCPGDNNQQVQKGYNCGPLSTKPISSSWTRTADGTKTGNTEYQHLEEFEITLPSSDSWHRVLPCEKVTVESVLRDLPKDLTRNWSLDDVEGAIKGLVADLERNNGSLKGCDTKKGSSHHSKDAKVIKK